MEQHRVPQRPHPREQELAASAVWTDSAYGSDVLEGSIHYRTSEPDSHSTVSGDTTTTTTSHRSGMITCDVAPGSGASGPRVARTPPLTSTESPNSAGAHTPSRRRRNVFYSTYETDSPRVARGMDPRTLMGSPDSPRDSYVTIGGHRRPEPRSLRSSATRSKKSTLGIKMHIAKAMHDLARYADPYGLDDASDEEEATQRSYKDCVRTRWNPLGSLIFLFFVAASIYYFVVRATKTLDMGYTWYGWTVLGTEIFTATSSLAYALLLCKSTHSKRTPGLEPVAQPPGSCSFHNDSVDDRAVKFHVRVLVPCYKETLQVVEATVRGALAADLPEFTRRTVYLCDDGKSPEHFIDAKRHLVDQLRAQGHAVVYVNGRARQVDEVNGKSNNLNNCLQEVIYKDFVQEQQRWQIKHGAGGEEEEEGGQKGPVIPSSEVLVIFDADMVPRKNFLTKVLEVMADERVSLCLTPQGFHNVNAQADIFNNSNLSFWEYILPGCDAFGYIACTGTNFCLRTNSLATCGWFPTQSITEDYLLGMLMCARGLKAVYLNEYLAVGEAPEEVRNIFRQRSRWCKGQMQVLFSKDCPLINSKLPMLMRFLYTSVTWCYITNIFAVPLGVLVPFVAIVIGYYPLTINKDFALATTLFYIVNNLVVMYCTSIHHVKSMWFCSVSCHLLWFTYTKATINVLIAKTGWKITTFKSTKKKGETDAKKGRSGCLPRNLGDMEATKDHYVIFFSFFISFVTFLSGVYQIYDEPTTAQGDFRWYLMLSIFWAMYNMIAPGLFIFYLWNKKRIFEEFCTFCMISAFLVAFGALACIWLVPNDYDFGQILGLALQFFEANRSGVIPRSKAIWWRADATVNDTVNYRGNNYPLVGGWYDSGDTLKMSYSIATTVTMLSWSFLEFKNGYKSTALDNYAGNTIRWGADYLMKCNIITSQQPNMTTAFVAQVGDVAKDHATWGRPEDVKPPRPAFYVDASSPGSDVAAAAAAALAATSKALLRESRQYSTIALGHAVRLYRFAAQYQGYYTKQGKVPTAGLYNSSSTYDDLAWAACWLYSATGTVQYLTECESWYEAYYKFEAASAQRGSAFNPYVWDYENVIWGVELMLSDFTAKPQYRERMRLFVDQWTGAGRRNSTIHYTPKGLAWAMPSGGLDNTMNAAFYTLLYAKRTSKKQMTFKCWSRAQVGYAVGDGGRSYVVGYGQGAPTHTPHRAASCSGLPNEPTYPGAPTNECSWETAYFSVDDNPHVLYGALVTGPDAADQFSDDRDVTNPAVQVRLINNAGFTATLAALNYWDINMAKCEQGHGLVQNLIRKARGQNQNAVWEW